MVRALNENEWKDKEGNLLISLGDNFDRGGQEDKVLDFFNSTKNKILIKGNHEFNLKHAIERRGCNYFDKANGTDKTIKVLSGLNDLTYGSFIKAEEKFNPFFNSMRNYYETENYIFVHGFLAPTSVRGDFRNAAEWEWEEGSWINGFAPRGKNRTGKTIVFGHWHTSWARARFFQGEEWGDKANFDILKIDGSSKYEYSPIIGIDGCTAYSGKVNVLKIQDELLKEEQGYSPTIKSF